MKIEIKLTQECRFCDDYGKDKHTGEACVACGGKAEVLTEEGKELVAFIQKYKDYCW